MLDIKQTTVEYLGHGKPEQAVIVEVAGIVVVSMWGGENVLTFQRMPMQNGITEVMVVDSPVDGPIEHTKIICSNADEVLAQVVTQLVRDRIAFADVASLETRDVHLRRVVDEASERRFVDIIVASFSR